MHSFNTYASPHRSSHPRSSSSFLRPPPTSSPSASLIRQSISTGSPKNFAKLFPSKNFSAYRPQQQQQSASYSSKLLHQNRQVEAVHSEQQYHGALRKGEGSAERADCRTASASGARNDGTERAPPPSVSNTWASRYLRERKTLLAQPQAERTVEPSSISRTTTTGGRQLQHGVPENDRKESNAFREVGIINFEKNEFVI